MALFTEVAMFLLWARVAYANYYGGVIGAPLKSDNGGISCPAGTKFAAYTVWCCPVGTLIDSTSAVCCPTSADCKADLINSGMQCADPSMTFYERKGSRDSYCCPSGLFLDSLRYCVKSQDPASPYTSSKQLNSLTVEGVFTSGPSAKTLTITGNTLATKTPTITAASAAITATDVASTSSNSGGLSQPATIGVGVGAGVGGLLVLAGIGFCLAKAGVFSSASAAIGGKLAGLGGAAGAGGLGAAASGAASSGANGAPPGDMMEAGKMGFYGYTPGGEATNFTAPPPGYTPTGAEAGNFSAPGAPGGLTGAEGANFTAPAHPGMGPTGAEGANFSAPGSGAEGTAFSSPGTGMGPTGLEGGAFSAPGTGMGPTGFEGGSLGATPVAAPGAPPSSGAYFAAPVGAAPLAAGVALLARRKQVGSAPSSATSSPPLVSPHPAEQTGVYVPPNMQHELGGTGVYRGSELGTPGTYGGFREL